MLRIKLGIIGSGNMGEAIIKGVLSKKEMSKRNIYTSDKIKAKAANLRKRYSIKILSLNSALVRKSQVIILAVKPQDASKVLEEIRYFIDETKLIISVMAGIKTEKIRNIIGRSVPVARVMPNMAAFVGESFSAISYNRFVKNAQKDIVRKLFKGIGEITEIDEKKQDAFTALSGSGPAYFCYMVECFVKAALKEGFSRKEALRLVVQTIKGSAKVLTLSGVTPEFLRKNVTSKDGTTEAAIKVFEKKALKRIIMDAVKAAVKRSRELSR